MNRNALRPLGRSLKMIASTVTPWPPVGGVAVAVPLPIRLEAGQAAGPSAVISSVEAVHWVAPRGSILVPLWSLIVNDLTPLGRPLAAAGSPKAVLNEIPVDAPAARVECLRVNVVSSLAARAAAAVAAATTATARTIASLGIARPYPAAGARGKLRCGA